MNREPLFLPRRCQGAGLQVLLAAGGVSVRAQVRQGEGPRLRLRRPHLPQQVLPHGRVLRVSTYDRRDLSSFQNQLAVGKHSQNFSQSRPRARP